MNEKKEFLIQNVNNKVVVNDQNLIPEVKKLETKSDAKDETIKKPEIDKHINEGIIEIQPETATIITTPNKINLQLVEKLEEKKIDSIVSLDDIPNIEGRRSRIKTIFSPVKPLSQYGKIFLPQDVPAWVLDLIKEHDLSDENHNENENDNIQDQYEWETVKTENDLKILQSKVNSHCFRCELKIKMMSAARVYESLLDLEARKLWDDSFDQGKIIHFFNSYRHCIVRQVNK